MMNSNVWAGCSHIILLWMMLFTPHLLALDREQAAIEQLIASKSPPIGVVFEIVGGNDKTLLAALKRSEHYIAQLKQQYPRLKFVIISHGYEQFSLQTSHQAQHLILHDQVQQMVQNENVPLQVCGALARNESVKASAFPDYVEVVSSGPQAIQNYIQQGYQLIEMSVIE